MYPPDCIFLFDDIFTAEECDYITDIINKHAVIDREVYEPSKNVLADSVNIAEILNKGEKRVCNFIWIRYYISVILLKKNITYL